MGLLDLGGGLGTALGAGAGFMIGGPAGAAWGAGLGAGLDTNAANAQRADSSNAWSAAQFANRYQTTVEDMKAAGLNPMLAYSQGGGSPPTAQQVQFQNPVSSAAQSYGSYAGAQQAFSSASQAEAFARQADVTATKIVEETKNVPFQGQQIKQTVQLLADQAALAAQQGETQVQIRKQIAATIEQIKIQSKSMKLDVDAAESLDNIGRTSKELKPIVDMIRSFFPSYHFGGRIPQ